MSVLGIDPSLSSSGFAYELDGSVYTGTIKTKSLRGMERLSFILDSLSSILSTPAQKFRLVVLEGYAMGAPGGKGRAFDIGELGGILKHHLWRQGYDMLIVPPSNLKKFATESGVAKKPEVIQSVASVWGYNVTQDDEADAFVLMQMGKAYLDRRLRRTYSEARRGALENCKIHTGCRIADDCK